MALAGCIGVANANGGDLAPGRGVDGDWEVTRVLMTGGMQTQWSMHEDDPRLMGRVLHLSSDAKQFPNAATGCTAQAPAGAKPQSMRLLFAKSVMGESKRPPAIKGSLYGRIEDYALDGLNTRPVILLEVRCELVGGHITCCRIRHNTADALQTAALALLRHPPPKGSLPDADQAAYCKQAVSASDLAICADRQLWRMYSYTLSAQQRAQSPRAEVNQALEKDIAVQLQKRQACNCKAQYLYEVLDWHIDLLVQRW